MDNIAMSSKSTRKITKASYSFADKKVIRKVSKDIVIVEQPLQVTLSWFENKVIQERIFAITMRTPGNDKVLILGLLSSEGVINSLNDIECITVDSDEKNNNQWLVQLTAGFIPELASLERYQITYSSCGLCGSTSLNALELKNPMQLTQLEQKFNFSAQQVRYLSNEMSKQQGLFSQTGGVHGAALFDQQASLLRIFEDIGRHNAVDKVIGDYLLGATKINCTTPDYTKLNYPKKANELLILLVSGRISFEIVQKTIMAGFSILVGVGAPSDLAIQAAQRFDLTLIGFASERGFNVYHGDWRLTDQNH